MNKIYVVSVFEKMSTKVMGESSDAVMPYIGCKVINGWYSSKEKAESILTNNTTDLWETCYHYGVIEECNEGMYDYGREKTYYKYNASSDSYEKMKKEDIPDVFYSITYSVSGIGM